MRRCLQDCLCPLSRFSSLGPLAARLRFAFASCAQYEQGWFGAYRHMANDNLDLVAFLGDYIYESSWGRDHVRKHDAGRPATLEQYRARYALYKSDPDLQRAHLACPWIFTWDDHEVENDYANDRSQDGMPREQFLAFLVLALAYCNPAKHKVGTPNLVIVALLIRARGFYRLLKIFFCIGQILLLISVQAQVRPGLR